MQAFLLYEYLTDFAVLSKGISKFLYCIKGDCMKKYGVNELRKMFLAYFQEKEHLVMKSFSLVPHNDNSLLLINSGMAPLKPYFTGQEIPPKRRVATCQKCIRTGDIENIGKTARHGTFFEMLGNFSFGDYFKSEALHFAWEFLTERVGLEKDRLYPSIYLEDEEAFKVWNEEIGIPADRIYRFGKKDNFWEHGVGPCGPCSEIYYDRGEKYGTGPEDVMGGEGDRFLEVWNVVFSQFNNDGKGNYTDLIQKNIDTGMGLERLAVVCQDVPSLFDVDTNQAMMTEIESLSGKKYLEDKTADVSFRIIADHVKSCTFMASDGIMPSNEGRGYVFRRLLRRAARHGRILGIPAGSLSKLSEKAIALSSDGYPELSEKKDMILRVISEEEDRFNKTIDNGLAILQGLKEDLQKKGEKLLSGEDAFRLYDTYGFPLDLTKEIMEDSGITVDEEAFQQAMKVQRETARAARKSTNYMGRDDVYQNLDASLQTEFVGYEQLECEGKITALVYLADNGDEDEIRPSVEAGNRAAVITDRSPFYGTMGGQQGDQGKICSGTSVFTVEETIHLQGGKLAHLGTVEQGGFSVGDSVTLVVDAKKRALTARNHTATHLLQKALKETLGSHVEQAGAYYDDKRLRFDFTHFTALTKEELEKVENLVNEEIARADVVLTREMPIEEAKKSGATALFGEKYGDTVRVVSVGDFSIELCGGTHVENSSSIQAFKILSEQGVAAGVRRIEAITSQNLFDYFHHEEELLKSLSGKLKADPEHLLARVESLEKELKESRSQCEQLKAKLANAEVEDLAVVEYKDCSLIATNIPGMDRNALRNLGDSLKDKHKNAFILLASVEDGKPILMATAGDGAVKLGAHAGNLIKEIAPILGGGGGGKPQMAQAGGKDSAKLEEALKQSLESMKKQLG